MYMLTRILVTLQGKGYVCTGVQAYLKTCWAKDICVQVYNNTCNPAGQRICVYCTGVQAYLKTCRAKDIIVQVYKHACNYAGQRIFVYRCTSMLVTMQGKGYLCTGVQACL